MTLVSRASGLLEPFEVPELTMNASIGRSLEMRGGLLLPRRPEYLPIFDALARLPGPWSWAPVPIPWENPPVLEAITRFKG